MSLEYAKSIANKHVKNEKQSEFRNASNDIELQLEETPMDLIMRKMGSLDGHEMTTESI